MLHNSTRLVLGARRRQSTGVFALALVATLGVGSQALGSQRAVGHSNVSLSANKLLNRSVHALLGENQFVIDASLLENGARLTFRVESAERGADVSASMTSHSKSLGFVGSFHLIEVETHAYLRASRVFWLPFLESEKSLTTAQANTLAKRLAAEWVALPASETASITSAFSSLTQPGKLAQALLHGNGALTEEKPTTFNGRAAIPIVSAKSGTIYIALRGAPLPLGASESATSSGGTVIFGYPRALSITAPAGATTF